MIPGPIFSREALTSPRQPRHFLLRCGYVALLLVLLYTAGQAAFGWQVVRNVGDVAQFGRFAFQILALVHLSLLTFFALLFSAGSVAQEKDRRTLLLLLMTNLSDSEVVLGKLTASLLDVGVLLIASLPAFTLLLLLGGVSLEQVLWLQGLCAATVLAAGSWGALVGFWREKTFQTLAIGVLGAVLFVGAAEAVVAVFGIDSAWGRAAALFDPYRALAAVLNPFGAAYGQVPAAHAVPALLGLAAVLNTITVLRLRVWNPSRSVHVQPAGEDDATPGRIRQRTRTIWSNPIIWREMRTRAYGRKVFVIKLAYIVLAAFVVLLTLRHTESGSLVLGMISHHGFALVGLAVLSLLLINAQAVTALTSERDGKTLELLLVTDLTAREFVFGKLGGVLYNTKELIAIPILLAVFYMADGRLTIEQGIYVIAGYLVLVVFAAVLGLHAGISYDHSRAAIAVSLGTMFFLFIGIFVFMMLLVEARSSFFLQFQSFILFIGAGSIGLWAALTHKNPSMALTLTAAMLPFLTFYAITQFLLDGTLGVFVAIGWAYGFASIAMLVPAVAEFDAALGRTTFGRS